MKLLGLFRHAKSDWHDPRARDFDRPLKASVWFTDLRPTGELTPSLFSQEGQRAELSAAIDGLNQKFGKHTVFLAGMSKAKNAAPDSTARDEAILDAGSVTGRLDDDPNGQLRNPGAEW